MRCWGELKTLNALGSNGRKKERARENERLPGRPTKIVSLPQSNYLAAAS